MHDDRDVQATKDNEKPAPRATRDKMKAHNLNSDM